jgi:outer membrane immunogenic protein
MPNWDGFYLGVATGARLAHTDQTINTIDEVFGPFVQHDLPTCTTNITPCRTSASYNATALRIGPYAGYNFQVSPQWLFGIEGDWAWANKSAMQSNFKYFIGNPPPDSSFAIRYGSDSSLRGRIGFLATPAVLVYATGGAAWLSTKTTSNCSTTSCFPNTYAPAVLQQYSVWTGWTAGGGFEWALASNWLLRGEYRFSDFGKKNFVEVRPCSPSPSPSCGIATNLNVGYDLSIQTQIITLGLAYRFGGLP